MVVNVSNILAIPIRQTLKVPSAIPDFALGGCSVASGGSGSGSGSAGSVVGCPMIDAVPNATMKQTLVCLLCCDSGRVTASSVRNLWGV